MSRLEPQMAEAITEHSMCQPGRPLPQGLSHDGSPGFEDFHSAKSVGDFFSDNRASLTDKSPARK